MDVRSLPAIFIALLLNSLMIPASVQAGDLSASDQLLKSSQENPATAAAAGQYQGSEYQNVLESLQKGLTAQPEAAATEAAAAPAADRPSRFEAIANAAPKVRANPYEVRNDLKPSVRTYRKAGASRPTVSPGYND